MKIAMVQMKVVSGDAAENRLRGLALAAEAARQADVIVLPEIWTTGYGLRNIQTDAEDEAGPTFSGLKEIAVDQGVTIISGSIPLRRDGKIYNGLIVIDKSGKTIADYQKIHLFSLFQEANFFAQGNQRCVFDLDGVTAGTVICYDLRFPELIRAMAIDGMKILFAPAEWPAARGEHWRLMNQARAVENQIFVCAVNCVGEHKGSPFYGHSMLIDPNGKVLAEGSSEEEIIIGEVDLTVLAAVRKNMTIWQDRRPEMYGGD